MIKVTDSRSIVRCTKRIIVRGRFKIIRIGSEVWPKRIDGGKRKLLFVIKIYRTEGEAGFGVYTCVPDGES